jgi:LuxR family maltose regulon positive regulatory protein
MSQGTTQGATDIVHTTSETTLGEVPRQRLLRVLRSTPACTVAIAAPSGYGKTTLVRQWAASDDRPLVEVRRSGPVRDASLVAEAVLAQLQRGGLIADAVGLPPAPDSLGWYLKVLPALGDLLAALDRPIMLVLDDITDLSGPDWEALVSCLSHGLPPGSVFCVVTRGAVPREIRQQRLHGTVLELGAAQLAFDAGETARLFEAMAVAMPDQDRDALRERAEGWPAVLYLCALALRDGHQVPRTAPEAAPVVGDFLRDNILDRLQPRTAEFLLKASVLEELEGPVCAAVTGEPDAEALLRELANTYRLIEALDRNGTRFRIHALLATFLSEELLARSQQEWRQAHVAASLAYEQHGDLDAAVGHAVLAADDALVTRLIWPGANHMLTAGRLATVRRWLQAAGPDRLAGIPELGILAAWAAQQDGDTLAMAHYQALAARACTAQQRDDLVPQVDLLWASMAVDGVADMERTAERIVGAFQPSDPELCVVLYHLGTAYLLQGQPERGIDPLGAGRRMAEALEAHAMHAILASELGLGCLETGEEERAAAALDEARTVLHTHLLDTIVVCAIPYAASAYGYARQGRLAEAGADLKVAVRLVSRLRGPAPWFLVRSTLMLAEVALRIADPQQARSLLREAEHHYGPSSACAYNDRLLQEVRSALSQASAAGVAPEPLTLAETRVLQYFPTHLTFPEIAEELFLSRFTVKTQALAAYRKLGAHSRREAVAKARALGLIPPA